MDILKQFGDYLEVSQMSEIAQVMGEEVFAEAVPVSQFNSFLKMIGEPEVELSGNELGAFTYNEAMGEKLQKFSHDGKTIYSNGKEYTVPGNAVGVVNTRITGASTAAPITLVYPDEDVSGFTLGDAVVNGIFPQGADREAANQAVWDKQNELVKANPDRPYSYFTTALSQQDSSVGLRVTISFVGIYLGITFLVTAAVILALQQLSAANDNKRRYATLRKLGTDEKYSNICYKLKY